MHSLAEHAPKSFKNQFIKLCRVTPRDLKEGAKIIFDMPHLIQWQVLNKNQRALSNKAKLQK